MQDNNSGKQFLFSCGNIFQKGGFISKKNDPTKKYIYLLFTHLAFSQFYGAMEVDC